MEVFLPANTLERNPMKIQQFQLILKTQNKLNLLLFPSTRLPKLSLFLLYHPFLQCLIMLCQLFHFYG